jgi:hypothetical protein
MKKSNLKAFILILIVLSMSSELFAQSRIRFARGRTSASVSGAIYGGGERRYVLGASYGQYLSANVSSRNGCVTFGNGSTSIGFTTDSGDNYLYLRNNCGRQTSFTLTVSINY